MAVASPKEAPTPQSQSLPRVRLELVDTCGRLAQALGLPRSVGEIYGLLYLAPEPMSAPEIAAALSISKGSVSTGTRQLLALGCIHKVWLQEERKDYFEAVLEMSNPSVLQSTAFSKSARKTRNDASKEWSRP